MVGHREALAEAEAEHRQALEAQRVAGVALSAAHAQEVRLATLEGPVVPTSSVPTLPIILSIIIVLKVSSNTQIFKGIYNIILRQRPNYLK